MVACNRLLPCLVAKSFPLPLDDKWSGAIPANCASLLALLRRLISPISARIFTAVMTFTPGMVVSVQPSILYICSSILSTSASCLS